MPQTSEKKHARNVQAALWDKDNTRQIKFKFNLRTDADILTRLDQVDNVQGYIKQLIRADIAANSPQNHFDPKKEAAAMTVINQSGKEIDFTAALALMDDDIRESLHAEGYETEQDFFTAYETAHAEKYGAPWELSKANPTW